MNREKIKAKWTEYEGSGNRTAYIGKVDLHVHRLIYKDGWFFRVAGIHNDQGPYDSPEEAQSAAIKYYNELRNSMPELEA